MLQNLSLRFEREEGELPCVLPIVRIAEVN